MKCGFIEERRSVPALQLRQQKEYRIFEDAVNYTMKERRFRQDCRSFLLMI